MKQTTLHYNARMQLRTLVIAVVLLTLPARAQNIPGSCNSRDWFQLQKRISHGEASPLCRGVLYSSLNKRTAAEQELKAVIRQMPHSNAAVEALEALGTMYFRNGLYREALAQLERTISENPDAQDAQAMHSLFAALAKHPDLTVASNDFSSVQGEVIGNNLLVPVTVNGLAATYILDSGAGVSVMSESEARRLGLKLEETTSKMSDISGTPSSMRMTHVPDLWLGKTHLKHVAFVVYPDENQPFVGLPPGHKGVLGISVLIALGTLRIDNTNHVQIGRNSTPVPAKTIPLAFDGMTPVTQMSCNGKTLSFTFDTGAETTYLGPVFAETFPELMRTGTNKNRKLTGFSGSTTQESIELPSIRFSFGKEVELAPATVLLKTTTGTSNWAAGNIGFDLIMQARPVTIDFRTMQLSTEDR